MKYFTADLHFWHKGIIPMCRKWFKDVEEMNEAIIASINSVVSAEDDLYILGDVSFSGKENTVACLGRLNGRLKVVPGNHDNGTHLLYYEALGLIKLRPPLWEIKENHQKAVLCHFPLLSWNSMHHGSWMLHGHCHGTLKWQIGRSQDVGWDVFRRPISWDELTERMAQRQGEIVDHHADRGSAFTSG